MNGVINLFLEVGQGFGIDTKLSIFAIFISIIAILLSIRLVYITKRLEIKEKQYNDLCINPINNILKGLDDIFTNHEHDLINIHFSKIPSVTTDFQLYVFELSNIYPNIDKINIVKATEEFTDYIFSSPNEKVSFFKVNYYQTKIKIYRILYDYIIRNEFKIFSKPKIFSLLIFENPKKV